MKLKVKYAMTAWMVGTEGKAQALAEQAEIAEQLGFHSIWLPEHHFTGEEATPSPLLLLAAIASRTSHIRLGTTSYLLPIRHPIQAAEEVAVLDRLSNGRVILGVGRGFRDALFTTFDIPVHEKRKRFAATLETMIRAWKGEALAREDSADPVKQPIYLAPLPVQQPHPPIWAAAFGPLAIKQAGMFGLPYLASPRETEAELASNYAHHQQALHEANHDPLETIPVMRTVFISRKANLIERVRQSLTAQGRSVSPDSTEATVDEWALVGEPEFVAEGIARYQERLGMTHLIARSRVGDVDQKEVIQSMEFLARM